MIRYLLCFLFVISFAAPEIVRGQVNAAVTPENGPDWMTFPEALEAAEAEGKYVIIDIYAPWCPWCQKMQEEVYTDDRVLSRLDQHFEPGRLDASDTEQEYVYEGHTFTAQQLAVSLGMRGTPTTVFLQSDGSYIAHLPGYIEVDQFQNVLDYISSGAHHEQNFQEYRDDLGF